MKHDFETIFFDSGAFTLFNRYVLKLGKRVGAHGRELAKPKIRWGEGDFSYYDLTKGSEFRKYCDSYASFIRKFSDRDMLFANVDVPSNPALTWEIQRFFEEEHGVIPIPVVHYGAPMEYVRRYVGSGKYDILAAGGLGQFITKVQYLKWGDELFTELCPESNGYMPVIKVHGFAMTSWDLMKRWPWWSVDSTVWRKAAAFGFIYVPRWNEVKQVWMFHRPPLIIAVSARSPKVKERNGHLENLDSNFRKLVMKWVDYLDLPIGSVDENGKMVEEGISSHVRVRSKANLLYFEQFRESLPEWPFPLSDFLRKKELMGRNNFGL